MQAIGDDQRQQQFQHDYDQNVLALHNGHEEVLPDTDNIADVRITRRVGPEEGSTALNGIMVPMTGQLMKYSPSLFQGWQTRHFHL